jgi:hypothetical protein
MLLLAGPAMVVGVLGVACPAGATDAPRPVLFVDDAMLERLKLRAASGEQPWAGAWAKVREAADKALEACEPPYTAEDSTEFRFAALRAAGQVRDLRLVQYVTGDEAYGRKAVETLLAWAMSDPLPGSDLGKEPYTGQKHGSTVAGLGLNVGLAATAVANAYSLVYPLLSTGERQAVEAWLRRLAEEIREGHQAWIENGYYSGQDFNNHLSGHNMGLAAIGFAVRDEGLVKYALGSDENPRDYVEMVNGTILMAAKPESQFYAADPSRVVADGEIYDRYRVLTIRGGKGYGLAYSFMHLALLTRTAEMAWHNGMDLYSYEGPNGENLKRAFEYYADFLVSGDPSIKGGYYENNALYLSSAHIYELANVRYPGTAKVVEVLANCERVVFDPEVFGWSAVLTHGEELGGE